MPGARGWVKPIIFTGVIGHMDDRHIEKGIPEKGMSVVKIGGPAFRIGIGGGAASSMIQGENIAELDFSAVQRGDAEMEQKVNRVIRTCVEMGERNPIISIHDQGAGANCNVVKEIIYPAGARIEIRNIQLGDHTLSVLEIWGAKYQEQDALLLHADRIDEFLGFCQRDKVPCAVIGQITGDGRIVIHDADYGTTPVNLELSKVDSYWQFVERSGERPEDWQFRGFVCTRDRDEVAALTEDYPQRWHLEEFFNFNQALGWQRAGTMNLNVRYAQMTLALIAQTVIHQLRARLGKPYCNWDANHLARDLFFALEGDVRVGENTILVTYYNAPNAEQLRAHYECLPQRLQQDNINPTIPWLYGYKLAFRFR